MDNKAYHKIITCAGYGETGSSVITDLLKEFDNCNSMGDYEFRFIQDYEGISTLEFALVHNYHRMNSDIAIHRFKKIIDYHSGNRIFPRYEKFFNGKFKEISYKYIDSLIDLSWKGYWEHHAIETNSVDRFLAYKIYPRIKKLFRKPSDKKFVLQPPKRTMYFSNPGEEFYGKTRVYTRELFNAIDPEFKYEYLVSDQLLPPSNLGIYLNYFDDIKVIIVDRDPRDIYMLNEFKSREGWIPSHDVDAFIKWFKLLRKRQKEEQEDKSRVLRIKFEDAVIKYDETLKEVLDFLGIDESHHIAKKKYFNPEISIKNVGIYKGYEHLEAIKRIEKELKEYCYE